MDGDIRPEFAGAEKACDDHHFRSSLIIFKHLFSLLFFVVQIQSSRPSRKTKGRGRCLGLFSCTAHADPDFLSLQLQIHTWKICVWIKWTTLI